MSKRLVRHGVDLDLWVQAQCAKLLMMLPTPDARHATVNWLASRVVHVPPPAPGQVPSVPEPPDPRQLELSTEPRI